MKQKLFYLVTTNDIYELPVCVGDVHECSKFLGMSVNELHCTICKHKYGVAKTWRGDYQIHRILEKDLCN